MLTAGRLVTERLVVGVPAPGAVAPPVTVVGEDDAARARTARRSPEPPPEADFFFAAAVVVLLPDVERAGLAAAGFGTAFSTVAAPSFPEPLGPLVSSCVATPAPPAASTATAATAAFVQPASGSAIEESVPLHCAIVPCESADAPPPLRPRKSAGNGRNAATFAATASRVVRDSVVVSRPARRASRRQGWQCAMWRGEAALVARAEACSRTR